MYILVLTATIFITREGFFTRIGYLQIKLVLFWFRTRGFRTTPTQILNASRTYTDVTDKTASNNGRVICGYCPHGTQLMQANGVQSGPWCGMLVDKAPPMPPSCSGVGNPIFPLTGTKQQVEELLTGGRLLMVYDSWFNTLTSSTAPFKRMAQSPPFSFGSLWRSSLHKSLTIQPGYSIQAYRGGSQIRTFKWNGSSYSAADVDNNDRLVATGGGFNYYDVNASSVEQYGTTGSLTQVVYADGRRLSYVYDGAGHLASVTDQFGRVIAFEYGANGITKITDVDGRVVLVAYDTSGRPGTVTWADGTHRAFVYANGTFPWALTGIVDENNIAFATFGYDSYGRATSTSHFGSVDQYTTSYPNGGGMLAMTEVADPANAIVTRVHSWMLQSSSINVTSPLGSSSSQDAVAGWRYSPLVLSDAGRWQWLQCEQRKKYL